MNKTLTTRTLPGFLNERGIGFDRMFNMIDDAVAYTGNTTYPPYNVIQLNEDDYLVELALAGFTLDDLEITQDGNKLRVEGRKPEIENDEPNYLHRGISARAFTREFVLAEHVTVEDATFENGIMSVKLHRDLPEAMKPRQIKIQKISK